MVNSRKIKGRLKELGFTQEELANKMGITQSTLSHKINNTRTFKLDEARVLGKILEIKEDDFNLYFFYS